MTPPTHASPPQGGDEYRQDYLLVTDVDTKKSPREYRREASDELVLPNRFTEES